MYTYKRRQQVFQFNDANKRLSSGMKAIYESIKRIAMDDLTETDFRNFYEKPSFKMADFTDILEQGEEVGFLYATFYHDPSSSPQYIAKAFQAVTKEKRQKGRPYDRSQLYKKFMEFYVENILILEFIKNGTGIANSWLLKNKIPGFSEILRLIKNSIASANKQLLLQVEIFAENPTTYFDICDFKLDHTSVKPSASELNWVNNLNEEQLLLESFRLFKKYENGSVTPPQYLEETKFTVNISPKEWRNSFKTTRKEKKFYIWQNYRFPDWAFRVIIPVNADNILNAIFRVVEKKGNRAIASFLDNTANYFISEAKRTNITKSIFFTLLAYWLQSESKKIKSSKNDFRIPDQIKKEIKKIIGI